MNARALTKNYAMLTAEERFRLIVAAHDRGDVAEAERLASAAKRVTFFTEDHVPYAHALQELAMVTLLELLDDVADCDEACQRWGEASMLDFADGKSSPRARTDDADHTNRLLELYRVKCFFLLTEAAGWELFCVRLGILPFSLWQYLPGSDRVRKTIELAKVRPDSPRPAFTREDVVRWMNRVRPAGDPHVTEADLISAVRYADGLEEAFHDRARWWGAE